jgi:thimet oligopeptidase
MSDQPAPVTLPAASDYLVWLSERCDRSLAEATRMVAELKTSPTDSTLRLGLWNDVQLALSNVFAVASLMAQVHPDEEVRTRAETAEQDAQRLVTDLGLDRELYDVLAGVETGDLGADARRFLTKSLLDFTRAGVDRDDATRDRLREMSERETQVNQEYSKNIRDGVRVIALRPEQLAGLPQDYVDAHPVDSDGQVRLTTEYPDYLPFMTFGRDRGARGELLHAYLNRAWPENDDLLREMLELRREKAHLLGYPDWASYDAEVKMIGSGKAIPEFIDQISALAEASAQRDMALLLERLQHDQPGASVVESWDRSYYGEVIRKERFDVDAQLVRTYFDFAKVRAGLLEVTGRLFGLEYVEHDASAWHDEVTCYDVYADGDRLGRIYLDLHPREGKYSHAAQFTLTDGVADAQLPEGVLVCNFPRGLMEHDDVVTLFHEFGHLVHHVLAGRQEWVRFSGVSTEWDFVEAPSQMLEEWAWDPQVLGSFATNEAGERIPPDLVERMRRADEFGKGYLARVQMFYAATSYWLHQDVPSDLTAKVRELQARYDLFAYAPETHFQASFGHLEGYTSAYYTYMWSLVIAKDMFSAFAHGDLFSAEVAHRYRDRVLVPGGSRDAADLVADFLGRPYSFDAFRTWLES